MLFETAQRPAAEHGRSLLFTNPIAWLTVDRLSQLPSLFQSITEARADGLWVAGYLSYECGYHWEPTSAPTYRAQPGNAPLAVFGVYHAPMSCIASLGNALGGTGVLHASYSMSPNQFAQKLQQIQDWIAAGDTYQVNMTFRIEATYPHGAAALFTHMMHTQPVRFGAMLNLGTRVILSASPELFFEQKGREITVRPMKGTSRCGLTSEEDERLAAALAADEKNRAENVMIVDLLRNDLGRIAETGSVRVTNLFAVERHRSLLQMTSEIQATLRESVDAYQLFASLFPSGSIVGAPKIRTMQLIRELEEQDRGPYTGAIGFFAPHDEAVFSVAIRTAVLQCQHLTMGVGAGITSDSKAGAEYEECLLKGSFLLDRDFELIETMRWQKGRCDLLALHLDRLTASARQLGFRLDRAQVQRKIEEEAGRLPEGHAFRLRVQVNAEGECSFTPAQVLVEETGPFTAFIWPVSVRSTDPWLAHKTTRRPVYDEAQRTAAEHGCIDAIFLNEHGTVTEGAIHSIFVRHGDRWRTPPASAGVLPGVSRRLLLDRMPQIQEEAFDAAALCSADEIWLTNAVRGVRAVALIESPSLP